MVVVGPTPLSRRRVPESVATLDNNDDLNHFLPARRESPSCMVTPLPAVDDADADPCASFTSEFRRSGTAGALRATSGANAVGAFRGAILLRLFGAYPMRSSGCYRSSASLGPASRTCLNQQRWRVLFKIARHPDSSPVSLTIHPCPFLYRFKW